jgi:hypothetical protein
VGLLRIYRRYCHRERMNARARDEGALESAWRSKQEFQPGTPLPAGFPFLAELAAGGYETQEDLLGADRLELEAIALLSPRDADAVLAAYALLPPLP